MSHSKFDIVLVIGRFQIFHHGHRKLILNAREHGENILVLIGSANIGRDTRNPFTVQERFDVLHRGVDEDKRIPDDGKMWIDALDDHPYDNPRWIVQVQGKVKAYAEIMGLAPGYTVGIVGHERDESVQYAKFFPQWPLVKPGTDIPEVNASGFRKAYFEGTWKDDPAFTDLPSPSMRFLEKFSTTPEFEDLKAEWDFNVAYPKQWGPGPHLTVDNVVVKAGHVLVVQRKNRPGKGRFAMPGGHLERYELLDHGAVRELWEETQLFTVGMNSSDMFLDSDLVEITKDRIWPHFRERKIFDKVNRSLRARVITEAFLFKLPDLGPMPDVIGTDDAERAFWMPLADVKPAEFFEDHAFIIDKMLGYL